MDEIARLLLRKPELASCENDIRNAANKLVSCFREGSKVLLCGNGGSCADCEHISGELVQSFSRPRPLPDELKAKLEVEMMEAQRAKTTYAEKAKKINALASEL